MVKDFGIEEGAVMCYCETFRSLENLGSRILTFHGIHNGAKKFM